MKNLFIKDIHDTVWIFNLDGLVNFSCVASSNVHNKEVTFTQEDKEDVTITCSLYSWDRLCNTLEFVS